MVEAVETMDGWYVLHDLRKIDWQKWQATPKDLQAEILSDLENFHKALEESEGKATGSHGVYHMVGQTADLMFMFLRPTIEEILALETTFNQSKWAEYFIPSASYISTVELSRYQPEKEGENRELLPETQARLKPIVPRWDYFSFYPMSRKREDLNNWYTLEKGERGKLLYEHSKTGRKYSGRVKQMITGSTGLDTWEWGVTLFSHDFLDLKKIVYEMRYDTATAKYGEFGPFYVGKRLEAQDLLGLLQ